jgi:hypothetical protein
MHIGVIDGQNIYEILMWLLFSQWSLLYYIQILMFAVHDDLR